MPKVKPRRAEEKKDHPALTAILIVELILILLIGSVLALMIWRDYG